MINTVHTRFASIIYTCFACGEKWKSEEDDVMERCPYCNSDDIDGVPECMVTEENDGQ